MIEPSIVIDIAVVLTDIVADVVVIPVRVVALWLFAFTLVCVVCGSVGGPAVPERS